MKIGEDIPREWRDAWWDDIAAAEAWRRQAREAFRFVDGHQWAPEDLAALKEVNRPAITFNRVAPVVDAICGQEIANRLEVQFLPREMGDVQANEILTGAAAWFEDQAGSEFENSTAFRDNVIGGMGWTETRLDFDTSDEGAPFCQRVDPFEMVWDGTASRPNLGDARRVWRVRKMPRKEAEALFPDVPAAQLNAAWAESLPDGPHSGTDVRDRSIANGGEDRLPREVTIVQVQWRDLEPYYLVADPTTGASAEFSEADYETLRGRMEQLGAPVEGVRRSRPIVRQAFLGGVVLHTGDAPCPKAFSYQCQTGKWDQTKRCFYGIVRTMIDPQMWANKWFSQLLHIMNTSAKGGIMVEDTAGDIDDIEETWAKSDAVTVFSEGALSGGKVQPKPVSPVPPHLMQMTEFAISSLRDVSGVNLEILGAREANQPGVLEYQRRQSAITILQWLFDAQRRYRMKQGELVLYYLQNDMSDGRLVRIAGKEGEQYVPLVREAELEYDIIIDDAPMAPNQKERTWQLLTVLLPTVREMLTPEVMLELLQYSPLPSSVVARLREIAQAPNPEAAKQAEAAARMTAAQIAGEEAGVAKTQAEVARTQADTAKAVVEMQARALDAQVAAAQSVDAEDGEMS